MDGDFLLIQRMRLGDEEAVEQKEIAGIQAFGRRAGRRAGAGDRGRKARL